jgi:hypothetical protein
MWGRPQPQTPETEGITRTMSYSVDTPKTRTREAWIPTARSATWWQLHKTRGVPAFAPTVTPVDPDSFSKWGEVIVANIVEANSQAIAIDAQLHEHATDRRVEVRWTEKLIGITIKRKALISLG